MRVALLSDTHGNLAALQAVLADIERTGVDQMVFLGDVATLGPQPKEVVELLRSLNCPCVQGNHDDYVLNFAQFLQDNHATWAKETIAWGVEQLSAADLAFIASFRPTVQLQLDPDEPARALLCFHGSPRSCHDLLLAVTPADEVDMLLQGHCAAVMAGGHTHVQMLRRHRQILIVNAGSVGLPMMEMPFTGEPHFLPYAEYALVDYQPPRMSVDLRQVQYDCEQTKAAALARGLPYAEAWMRRWQ
ncbi:MAG: metallophosphoesterase family protein [Caldilineaceae bacterium]